MEGVEDIQDADTQAAGSDLASWASSPGVFYTEQGGTVLEEAPDPIQLAGTPSGLDVVAVVEEAAIGYQLGSRTLFPSVHRLLPWQRLAHKNGSRVVESRKEPDSPADILECLSERVCSAFKSGAALELTGGLDTCLLLAAALARDVKPELSFTIGHHDGVDVTVAAAIAERYGFPHIRLQPVFDRDRIAQDTWDFIRASGYSVNASSYACLPATLDALREMRTAQVTGTGGEIVGGFYYTPFDSIIEALKLEPVWVRKRLMLPWIDWRGMLRPDALNKVETFLMQDVLSALRRPGNQLQWRQRVDMLYRNERIRRWAIPVLDASKTHYDVVAPFLSPEYLGWARALPVRQRADRQAQRDLLRRACPALAEFRQRVHAPSPLPALRVARKVYRRLGGAGGLNSQSSSAQSSAALVSDPTIVDQIRSLVSDTDVGFSEEAVARILQAPLEHPEVIGVLVTAGLAWNDLRKGVSAKSKAVL